MAIRILLVDDHTIMRNGLRALLKKESDIEVVAEAGEGRAAMQLTKDLLPDVVIMDVAMPGMNGIEATREIHSAFPQVKVVALSMHSDRRFVAQMLRAGALGYLLKDCAYEELATAIRTVTANRTYLSARISDVVIGDYLERITGDEHFPFSRLSPREREVLQLIAEGKGMREIAGFFTVSIKTVETHRAEILKKLGVDSVAGLVKIAIREGLVSLDS